MHTSLLTGVVRDDSMVQVIRPGGFDGGGFRYRAVWRPPAGKRGAQFHRSLVETASPSIRRLAGDRSREVQYHRFLRNERVSVAEMAATVGARTGARGAG